MADEINENDPKAREIREKAVEYAERVQNGEEPWLDEPATEDAGADASFEADPEPKNDVVEDTDKSDSPEAEEVADIPEG